ncbi:MAG: PAS-domain containing protein [Ferrovibrionaceae bacterium]
MDATSLAAVALLCFVMGALFGIWWRSRQIAARDAFFREILNVMPVGVLVYGRDDRLLLRNQRMQELFPVRDPDGVIGTHRRAGAERLLRAGGQLDGLSDDEAAKIVDRWVTRVAAEGYVEEEFSFTSGRVVRYQARPVSTGGLVIVQTDITALKVAEAEQRTSNSWLIKEIANRKKAESEVAQAATRLRQIIDAIPVGVVVYDPPDDRISVCNQAIEDLYPNYSGQAVIGMTRRERLRRILIAGHGQADPPADLIERKLQAWLAEVEKPAGGLHQLSLSGRSVWVKSKHLDDGTTIVTNIDVTDLRRAEQRLRDAIDNNDSAIQLYDAELRLILWNDAVQRILPFLAPHLAVGLAYDEAMKVATMAGILPADSPYFRDIARTGVWQGETLDGRFILARHIRTAEGGLLVVHTDLTRLHVAQQSLSQAEQMAALGRLVAGVSHEINTPIGISLTAIGALDLRMNDLQRRYRDGSMTRRLFESLFADLHEATEVIQRNLERAADLVASFKRISVDQAADTLQRIDLGRYLHDIVATLRPTLRGTPHRLVITCPDGIQIDTYPGALSQIVTNLVLNSLSHGFPEGRIGNITLEAAATGDEIALAYRDDGVGVSRDTLKRIFEPFFTTARGRGGSGLGLSIIYNIVTQQLGGTIVATSEESEGLAFQIRIPRQPVNLR